MADLGPSPAQPSSQRADLRVQYRAKNPKPKVQSAVQSPELRHPPEPA